MQNRAIEFSSSRPLPKAFVEALSRIFHDDELHQDVQETCTLTWHETHDRLMELAFYFYLCYKHRGTAIAAPPRLDPVWHVFLGQKEKYEQYCMACFGGIVEHRPYEAGTLRETEAGKTLECVGATFGGVFTRKWSGLAQCDGKFKAAS